MTGAALDRVERIEDAGSAELSTVDFVWLLEVVEAAALLGQCLLGRADDSPGLAACNCDGCDLRRALEHGS